MSCRLSKSATYPRDLHPGTFLARKRGCLKTERSEEISNNDKIVSMKNGDLSEKDTSTAIANNCIQPSNVQKKVSFHIAEFQHYARQPGDNPSVSAGVALSLGWEVLDVQVFSIDEYERQVGVTPARRYTRKELALSREEREQLLHEDWGCSLQELFDASEISREAKQKRIETLILLRKPRLRRFDQIIENSVRKFDRLLNPRRQDVKQLLIETQARDSCLEINTSLGNTTSNQSIYLTRNESVPILYSLDRSQQFSESVEPSLRICRRRKSSEDLRDFLTDPDTVTDELNDEVKVSKPISSFSRLKPKQIEKNCQGLCDKESTTFFTVTDELNDEVKVSKPIKSFSRPKPKQVEKKCQGLCDKESTSFFTVTDELNDEVKVSKPIKSLLRLKPSQCPAAYCQHKTEIEGISVSYVL
eukprot:CAMPEP_0172435646 /NCGR_PEP_ID=MMETSP1064-20121228/71299_1 /TAXON_ID=202472 /ORGANISM="Aulacoseira subarctica , Strain CCAP 1002/5" /LENGTH=416 /DNA_ID=CAMNT_0013183991 /DNA_START=427 /DNA_END=1677 /DNA_ORIENTATION=-